MNIQFKQIFEQPIWTELWTITLNWYMNIQFDEKLNK